MSAPTDIQTAAELARLRSELHATNAAIQRIATALERTLTDHETRLRAIEIAQIESKTTFRTLYALVTLPTTGLLLFALRHFIP